MTTITKKNPDKWYWYTILLIFALMALIGIKNCQGQNDIWACWKLQRQEQQKEEMNQLSINDTHGN